MATMTAEDRVIFSKIAKLVAETLYDPTARNLERLQKALDISERLGLDRDILNNLESIAERDTDYVFRDEDYISDQERVVAEILREVGIG
ncbi:hypothetical protein TAMA11512_21560 [Selenomonas sp. TAMA-11512]|uniref:hypothetical protein n=1 Tax=Selenomonas sp. TAMA-11512 TaxID=3095337 RepID=UPI003085508C|nr:hypothetical protein TAMA11512_09040 [Selenomonas sp. TAMA-11512]BEU88692.1 hypothetical protein TAMA11512_21560 [Selenomonas sp. TAMA-11512]